MIGCGKTGWRRNCLGTKCGDRILVNSPTGNIMHPGQTYETDIVLLCPECSSKKRKVLK